MLGGAFNYSKGDALSLSFYFAGITHHLSLGLYPPIGIYANVPDDTDVL
jgi:hypothetical protein